MNRSNVRVFVVAALFVVFAVAGAAQSNDCGVLVPPATTASLPKNSGTLAPSADMSLGGASNYLYVLTQWGLARGSLTNPANPGPYSQVVVGQSGGNGGVIPIICDCHQGWNTFDVAEGPGGTTRMVGDWVSYTQGGPPPPNDPNGNFSGLPAQLGQATGAGGPAFGQQIDLPDDVPNGARVAAIYISSTGKYFGYFPVRGASVQLADLTSPTGNPSYNSAIQPVNAIGWTSTGSGAAVRLAAAHVTVPGYDKYLLVGTTNDLNVHVAEIKESNGIPTEVANGAIAANPAQLDVEVINNRIFIFAAEELSGARVYEFQPPSTLLLAHTFTPPSGQRYKRAIVRGPQPFPALFLHRSTSTSSFIEIYDTKWLTQGGTPLLAKSIQHQGASDADYLPGYGFEALVQQSGANLFAYLYREVAAPPPGLPAVEDLIHTDKIDISCIAADPSAPPIANAVMTNLSAAGRPSPENAKNYYGDKWELKDASVSYQPLTNISWDINVKGQFLGDAAWTGVPTAALTDILPAYWPCDPGGSPVGNLTTGASCWASLGSPQSGTYTLGLKATNINGPSAPYLSSGTSVVAPALSIVGYDGTTLSVLAGNPNNGDASASKGNTAEASFAWTFTPSGSASGTVVNVPSNATAFSLTATYKGGFTVATGTKPVQQVDLVANASLTPSQVLKSGTLTLKNLMQKAAAATLNSVTYSISSGGGSGTLAATFNTVNATATVTAPGTIGSYSITLTYHYTDHLGASKTAATPAMPFTVVDFQPKPTLGVYTGSAHTGGLPYFGSWSLTQGTTYYLFDDETLPPGFTHPGASFYKSTNSSQSITGDALIGSSTGYGPVTFSASVACSGACYFKVSVPGGASVDVSKYNVAPAGCTVNCGGGGGNPTLALSGPSSGVANTPVTFTATATNFPGAVTYSWDFGDGGSTPPPPPPPGGCFPGLPGCNGPTQAPAPAPDAGTPGPATNSHTYTATGAYTVIVTASSGSTTKTTSQSISIGTGGPPLPSNGYTVTGAEQNTFSGTWEVEAGRTVTFSGTEPNASAFDWAFSDGATASGRTVTHSFGATGSQTATLTVTGDGTNTSGTSNASIRFNILVPSFRAVMIPGASSIESQYGNWATDLAVTNPGTKATTVTLYFAAFTDTIPSDLSTLPFDSRDSFQLAPGQSWSGVDVVGSESILNRHGAGKGILLLKYDGGDQAPIATAQVYFTAQGSSFGAALPTLLVGPYGPLEPQDATPATDQILIGLRNDELYRFNVSLFNAGSQSGLFHVDAFTEDGQPAGSRDFGVPAYSQAGVNDTDVIDALDTTKRYVLKAHVVGSTGVLQAYASELDRRNSDLVQVSDDGVRAAVAPGTTVSYYLPGVGRIEEPSVNAHWRTDVRFYNGSSLPRDLALEYRYTPAGSSEQVVSFNQNLKSGQGVSLDDIVGNYLDEYTPADLKTGTAVGLLKVSYEAPTDSSTAPLIIGGRIYTDLPTGTAGMQLSSYSTAQSVSPGNGALVMPGAQLNLRFRTNIGLFSLGQLPTRARISAIRQDGTVASTYDYILNDPGKTGTFVQIPMSALANIDGNTMTIRVESIEGSPVGAYIVLVDQISTDTVFVKGKPVS